MMSLYQLLCLIGVQGLITTIVSIVITKKMNKAERKAEKAHRETEAIGQGVKALLRDRLLQGYKHYVNDVGWADEDDRSNMENVYKQYHALGGNGTITKVHDEIMEMPII